LGRLRGVARLVHDHPAKLARLMGFDLMVDGLHDRWISQIAFGKGDKTILAHRGGLKTTADEVAIFLHMLVFPMRTLLFLRKTEADVAEVMGAVRRMLESDAGRELSRIIYHSPAEITVASQTSLSTNLATNPAGSPQVTGYGINGSLTGKHADLIITDDIVTVRDRVSRAERERTKQVYRELQNVRNRGGRIVNTGTPWHPDDAIETLMPEAERWPWDKTGLVTQEQADELKRSMTRSLFAANYELRHVADEGVLLKGEPTGFSDEELLYNGIMHIDAAYGGDDGTALTCIAWHDGEPYVHGELWPSSHVDKHIEHIIQLHDRLRLGTVHLERNADKGYLADKLEDKGLPTHTYQERENKFVKISTHARGEWPHMHRYESGDDASAEYWDQVMGYAEGSAHDDAPDSLASAIRLHDSVQVNLFRRGI